MFLSAPRHSRRVFSPARGPRGRRLLEALRKRVRRRPPHVVPLRSWLRCGAGVEPPPVTFRRYVRHRCARLAADEPGRWRVLPSTLGNRLVRPFCGAGQWHLYMQHRFTVPSFLATRQHSVCSEARRADSGRSMRDGSSFAGLAKMTDPARIVAMDLDPESAYAADAYSSPMLQRPGLGYRRPAAPPRRKRRSIFCLDPFHYVTDKRRSATKSPGAQKQQSYCRSASPQSLPTQPGARYTTVAGWIRRSFSGTTIRMYPEDQFLRAQLLNGPIDLHNQRLPRI